MSELSMFLAQNAGETKRICYAASKRFTDAEGKPALWEVSCITSAEDEMIRKDCTRRIPTPGKKGRYTSELDINLYMGRLAAKCTVFPALDDAALQNSYSVMGAEALLKTMLTPGEFAEYCARVQEVNGFDSDPYEEIEEAKN